VSEGHIIGHLVIIEVINTYVPISEPCFSSRLLHTNIYSLDFDVVVGTSSIETLVRHDRQIVRQYKR
jgi:hypothetical protein